MITEITKVKRSIFTIFGALSPLLLATPALANIPSQSLDPCVKMKAPWNGLCSINANNLGQVISNLILLLFIVAAIVALFFLIWGGIKWIISGGDKTKVDTARSTIIAALVGLIITFLAFFLLQIILGIFGISLTNLELPKLLT